MTYWLIIFGTIYLFLLGYSGYKAKKSLKTKKDYSLPQIGVFLGFLTFSATLFSTFTLMGMPDFFRQNGVGAWIFLGVTDTALAFVVLWFGIYVRRKYSKANFSNVSGIIKERFGSNLAVNIYRFGILIFLIPYVAIQIKGVSEFIAYSDILNIPIWGWALLFLSVIMLYSYFGGLKAIIYSDAIQGGLLLIVTTIIAITCILKIGGVEEMFNQVALVDDSLLSVPGPNNLLTSQFLFASFIVIVLMPISQPQLFTRIIIMNKPKDVKRMAIAVSIFAFMIILPTVFIGFFGSIKYADVSTQEFLFNTLVSEQIGAIGALAIIGLIASAMSTTDSQLFAMQTELLGVDKSRKKNKLLMFILGGIALLLSVFTSKELVLLARVSFAGTALLAPMIFLSVVSAKKYGNFVPIITFLTLIAYIFANFTNLIPAIIIGIRLDMFLLGINILASLAAYLICMKTKN